MSGLQDDSKNWCEISGTNLTPYFVYGTFAEVNAHMGVLQSVQIPSNNVILACQSKVLSAEELATFCAENDGKITGIDLTKTNINLKTLTVGDGCSS